MKNTYRIWDKRNERMIYSTEPKQQGKRECYPFVFNIGFSHWEKEDLIIMQSTGIIDKNGEEIFEGDICNMDIMGEGRMKDNFYFFHVKNLTLGFEPCDPSKVHEDDRDWRPFYDQDNESFWDNKYFEIIGNIYQHPELLK